MRRNARDACAHGESVSLDVSLEPGGRLPQTAFERLILERDTVLNELVWQRRKWLLPVPRLNEALTWLAPQCGEPLLAALERARGVRRPEQMEDFCLRNHLAQLALVLCPRLELFIGVRGDTKAVIFLTCLAERLAIAVAVGDEDRVVDVARDDQAPWSAGGAVLRSGFVKGKRDVDTGDGHHRSGIDVDPPALLVPRERARARETEEGTMPVFTPDERIARRREGDALHVRLNGQLDATRHRACRLPLRDGRRAAQLRKRGGVRLYLCQRLGDIGIDQQRVPRLDSDGVGVIRAELQCVGGARRCWSGGRRPRLSAWRRRRCTGWRRWRCTGWRRWWCTSWSAP